MLLKVIGVRNFSFHFEYKHCSVLELRSAKIRNFLDVKRWPRVKKFIKIHYESLVNFGLKVILDKIENGTGMKPSCDMFDEKPPIVGGLETLDEGLIHWLNDNVDWKAERRIKYNINSRPYSPLTSPTVAPDGSDVIERIALLGERNTGSRWVTKKLRECYPELKVIFTFITRIENSSFSLTFEPLDRRLHHCIVGNIGFRKILPKFMKILW